MRQGESDMVTGVFGVFDDLELLAEFGNDDDAESYRSDVLELNVAEGFRRSAYDDLQVAEVPEDYDPLYRTLKGLRRSRNQDRSVERFLEVMRIAQQQRAEARRDA